MRLLWRLFTPRGLRRGSLILLLVWTMIACADHLGVFAALASLSGTVTSPDQLLPVEVFAP